MRRREGEKEGGREGGRERGREGERERGQRKAVKQILTFSTNSAYLTTL